MSLSKKLIIYAGWTIVFRMSNEFYFEYLNFLKTHNLYGKEAFHYIQSNALYIDYRDKDSRDFIGCFYIYENNYLTKIRLCVPYIYDEKTVLINIHEYVHAYLLYSKLHTKYKIGKEKEVIPMLYEKLYMLEHPSKELEKYEHI